MIDVRLLETFVHVCRTGSFVGAARALSFTPSAVSQQMAQLELRTGSTLFDRVGRGVRPTHAGAVFLVHAQAVLDRLEDAQAELDSIAGLRGGRVRLGCFPSATSAFAAAASHEFSCRHPEVVVSYSDGEPYEIVQRIRARELDLALVFAMDSWPIGTDYNGVRVTEDEGVDYVDLFDDPFMLVLPRDHRFVAHDTVPVAELADERFAGGLPWIPEFRRICGLAGFEPHFETSYRSATFDSFQAFVGAGQGLTLIPELALPQLRTDVVVRPLDMRPVRHVKVALPAGAHHGQATLAMLELFQLRGREALAAGKAG